MLKTGVGSSVENSLRTLAQIAGTAFQPTDVAGLKLWLSADSLGLANAAAVSSWPDLSGQANDASQATSTNQPTYRDAVLNSRAGVRFITDDWMQIADVAALELNGDCTVFAVIRRNSSGAQHALLSKDAGAASAGAFFWYINSANKIGLDRPFVQAGAAGTSVIGSGANHILSVEVSGTSVSHYLNGVANGTDTLAGGTQTNQPLRIGAFSNGSFGSFLSGDVGMVLVYNVALSTANRDAVTQYLGRYYSLAVSP